MAVTTSSPRVNPQRHFDDLSGRYGGELWLRDAEMSAWRVALAGRREFEAAQDRERFFEAWRRA